MRQIAPDLVAPTYGDPSAPSHKLPPAPPPPPPVVRAAPAAKPAPVLPPPITPSRDKPLGACEAGMNGFVACLTTAAELADRSVGDAERAAIAAIGKRADINPVVADGATRGLHATGDLWRMLRDRECADLPLVETGLDGSLFQRRLLCRIQRDVDRVETLRQRYGGEVSNP